MCSQLVIILLSRQQCSIVCCLALQEIPPRSTVLFVFSAFTTWNILMWGTIIWGVYSAFSLILQAWHEHVVDGPFSDQDYFNSMTNFLDLLLVTPACCITLGPHALSTVRSTDSIPSDYQLSLICYIAFVTFNFFWHFYSKLAQTWNSPFKIYFSMFVPLLC